MYGFTQLSNTSGAVYRMISAVRVRFGNRLNERRPGSYYLTLISVQAVPRPLTAYARLQYGRPPSNRVVSAIVEVRRS